MIIESKRILLTLCLALSIAATIKVVAEEYTAVTPEIISTRLSAMGGANPALTGQGADTLSTNPAAFAFENQKTKVIGLNTVFLGSFSNLINIINNSGSGTRTEVINSILSSVRANDGEYFGGNITGPLSIAYTAKNFGFGIFNRTYALADLPSVDSGYTYFGEELLITGGFGINIISTRYHELAFGMQAKVFFQAVGWETDTAEEIINTLIDFSMDEPGINSAIGAGFDLGLLYRFAKSLSVGVVYKDVYSPVFYRGHESINDLLDMKMTSSGVTVLESDLQVGIGWQPHIPHYWHTITDFTLAAGFRDLLNVADSTRHPILNLSVGMEAVLFDVFAIRAGLNEAHPAVGIGFNIKSFQLDATFYGRELGTNPGERSLYSIVIGFAFGF